jgi:transposase-like protein
MKKTMTPRSTPAPDIAKVLKRLHYPLEVILLCVRWYVAYSLSLRNLEEMMAERDICVDHSTVHRWVIMRCTVNSRHSFLKPPVVVC